MKRASSAIVLLLASIVPVIAGGSYISAVTGLKNLPDKGIEFVPFIVSGPTPEDAKSAAMEACKNAKLGQCLEEITTNQKCIFIYKSSSIEKNIETGEDQKINRVFLGDNIDDAGRNYVAIMNKVPSVNDMTRFCQ